MLTPQGKYLYDFIVVKHKNGFFLDCEKSIAEELYKKIISYKLRSKVEILNLSNEFVVAAFAIFLSGHSSIMPISINSLKNIQVFEL